MDGISIDVKQQKIDELKGIFPEAFAEDKIDWEKLQATLGKENIEFQNERYVLNWAGKTDAFKVLQQSTTATLKPVPDESVNFNTTENVFIEGENLEVLKVLQKAYYGKIKCIIIDPPYNTGSDSFIYPDSFKESKEDYQKRIGEIDEEGYLMKEGFFRKNSKDSGHFHSNWLSMMYPRLFLAKNLLCDDGVIFIHIDDNEVHNLRLVMNEIFGEENFVSEIVWKKKTGSGSQIEKVFSEHEYVLAYVKNNIKGRRWRVENESDGNFQNPDNDSRDSWESCAITAPSKNRNPNQLYQIEVFYNQKEPNIQRYDSKVLIDAFSYGDHAIVLKKVDSDNINEEYYSEGNKYARFIRRWAYIPSSMKEMFEKKRVYLKEGNLPRYKKFEYEYAGKALRSIYFSEFSTQQGSEELRSLFNSDLVEYPKPKQLLKIFIDAVSVDDDIIFDFFAGSATTAQAVLELNKEDGGKRKFILAQLPEKCEEESEAYKAGYQTIAEIGKERIRRVIKKIKDESRQLSLHEKKLDLGFKVFKLSSSNFKIWRSAEVTEENLENQLDAFTNPVKEGSETENILYELILKAGYLLTDKIETKDKYYSVNDGELIIALEKMDQKLVNAIITAKPKKVITLDKLFTGNDQLKTNTVLQMRDNEIDFRTI